MDYITLEQLQNRGAFAAKYNTATGYLTDIRRELSLYETSINSILDDTDEDYDARDQRIDAAIEVLKNTLEQLNGNDWIELRFLLNDQII